LPEGDTPSIDSLPPIPCRWLEQKSGGCSLPQILYNSKDLMPTKQVLDAIPNPANSFTDDHKYLNDIVLKNFLESNGISATPFPEDSGVLRTLASLEDGDGLDEEKTIDKSKSLQQKWGMIDHEAKVPSDSTQLQIKHLFAPNSREEQPKTNLFSKISHRPQFSSLFRGLKTSPKVSTFFSDPQIHDQQHKQRNREVFICQVSDDLAETLFNKVLSNILPSTILPFLNYAQSELKAERCRKWISICSQFNDYAFSAVISESIARLVEMIARKEYSKESYEYNRRLSIDFSAIKLPLVIEAFINKYLRRMVEAVFEEQKQNYQKELTRIRMNLHREWIRQFTSHWRSIVKKKRTLRDISVGIEQKERTLFIGNTLYRKNHCEPFTPERMQLQLYLRHFRRARTQYLEREYFCRWRNFVPKSKRQKLIQSVLFSELSLKNLSNKQAIGFGLYRPTQASAIQFPLPPTLNIHTPIGRKHLLRRSFSPPPRSKLPRHSDTFNGTSAAS